MSASVIESVRATRMLCPCDHGHNCYTYWLSWTEPDGEPEERTVTHCPHPLCDTSPWQLPPIRPHVLLTAWIPKASWGQSSRIAAYLLTIPGTDRVVARIGICAQWEDRQRGNGHGLFTERYFGESGPGIYPVPIEDGES
jgi:hypothetical protein